MDFDDLTANYTISYGYHIAGELRSITDPSGAVFNYTNDKTGRLTEVKGANYPSGTNQPYANNIQYRAFGEVKEINYVLPNSSVATMKMDFDNGLRVSHYEATQAGSTTSFALKSDYTYASDGRATAKNDLLNDSWDATMKYDFAARLTFNQFGMGPANDPAEPDKRVYEQAVTYDAFSNMTARSGVHWDDAIGMSETYTNGRINAGTTKTMTYDAAGNLVFSKPDNNAAHDFQENTFDAVGRRIAFRSEIKGRAGSYLNYVTETKEERVFDGDGRAAYSKSGVRGYNISSPPSGSLTTTVTTYAVWSTVLGQILTELMPDGSKLSTSIYAGGAKIGTQGGTFTSAGMTYDSPGFETADPVTGASAQYSYDPVYGAGFNTRNIEPLGQEINATDPVEYNGPPSQSLIVNRAGDPEWQCAMPWTWKFMPFHCQQKVIKSAGTTLPWEFETKTSVKRIVGVDAPANPYRPSGSGSNLAMAYALRSTAKPDDDPESKNNRKKRRFEVTVHAPPDLPIDLSERFDASVGMIFDDFTIAPGQSISENPCELMAQSAQNIIDNLKNYPSLTDQQKLEEFTRTFQTWYTGGWVGKSNWSAATWGQSPQGSTEGVTGKYSNLPWNKWDYNQMSGRAERLVTSSPYRGQKDFLSLYRQYGTDERRGDGEDQTHHFAAYFALGSAALSFAAWARSEDSSADKFLGDKAYSMGDFLRRNPNELKNFAYSIRADICAKPKTSNIFKKK